MEAFINNPNVVYVLFLVGIYGLFFELYNPGLLLPGITGIACLFLALYAFQSYPTNYTGLGLLTLGLVLMVIEVLISSYGVMGLLGLLAFVLGSLYLFNTNQVSVSWQIIAIMAFITAIFFWIAVNLGVRAMKQSKVTGVDTLIGKTGEVLTIVEDQYQVRILGEIWNAQSTKPLQKGDKVCVIAVSSMLLSVELVERSKK